MRVWAFIVFIRQARSTGLAPARSSSRTWENPVKLRRAQVQHFRSIVDSGLVEIEDRVTVLIGKNEQGKTTFLRALASSNPKVVYSPADLPNHLRPSLEEGKPSEIPIVTLWLSLEPPDLAPLRDIVPDITSTQYFRVIRFYDGHHAYESVNQDGVIQALRFSSSPIEDHVDALRKHSETLKAKLTTHGSRLATFAPALPQADSHINQFIASDFRNLEQNENLVKTFATGLTSLPGQDAAIQEDIASALKDIQAVNSAIALALQKDPVKIFEQTLPHFVLHSTILDKIPNEVSIAEFVKSPEATSKGMANLCGVAGLSMQKIQQLASSTDTPTREGFEDHFRARVSGGINEFWTQETYTVHFRFEKDKMSVSISDGTYSRRIAPAERSDGFQWYLSFYAAMLNEVSSSDSTVFLLDNPGLELHADGQKDIKKFLEEKLPASAQVLYVTHSSAMIDPFNLEQIRQVDLRGDMQGTKIGPLAFKEGKDFDLLEPVRSAIGASLASSLIFNEFNVLVEGAADKPILEGAFRAIHKDTTRKILVNGSVAESKDGFLVRFYQRAGLPFVVYLDADSSGRDLARRLEGWGVPNERILDLANVITREGQDFELEDVLTGPFYHAAVQAAYPESPVEAPGEPGAGKRTKYYEDNFKQTHKIGFNKRRVGEKVKKLLLDGAADDGSIQELKKVTDAILALLETQVKAAR